MYLNHMPRIEPKFRPDNLPSWDGDAETAIDYFVRVDELAQLGGSMPQQLGMYLWTQFLSGSEVERWWFSLPEGDKSQMRTHYLAFLEGLRDQWLGEPWKFEMRQRYTEMRFRQAGHSRESPVTFTQRRLMTARMLNMVARGPDGAPLPADEVQEVYRVYSTSWNIMLKPMKLRSSMALQAIVKQLTAELLMAYEKEASRERTTTGSRRPFRSFNRTSGGSKSVSLTMTAEEAEEEEAGGESMDEAVAEAFAIIRHASKRVFSVVPGKFAPRDEVKTKMCCPPPGPCRVCSSKFH
ncbi:hypothetical protein PsYK624_172430 [Phanerochaete sordida]|uniref:Uncharacterized protein n=1 Tax=Phanerochaete sordida TaxID=48140 RepID=A0A9P3GSC9_9APHY|nr:hypothetical protein PsYK624_172430 [Phanerochaete sordida]